MPKYDTDTAQRIASAVGSYSRDEDTRLKVSRDVYRTGAGAFFLVDCIESLRDKKGVTTVVATTTIFFPLSYDEALAFVRGYDLVVTGIRLGLGDMQVDILDETVFPPVTEEASGEETD